MNQSIFIIYAEILLILGLITFFFFNKPSTFIFRFSGIALIVLPIIFFYYTIYSNTDNIPFKDDYSLLDSIYQMEVSSSFYAWTKAFIKQVNQHRFGFERSVMWLIYKVLGNENIKSQIIIGNSFLLGILYLLLRIFKNFKLSLAYFIPLPLLLFNLTYFENATWGIAAIQNTPIIFFALLTTHFLISKKRNEFYLAILFATITLFTSGNGLAMWFVGILLLSCQRQWKKLGVWSLAMLSLFAIYFMFDYEIIPSNKENLLNYPFYNVLYILAFWGNVFLQNIPHPQMGHRYLDVIICILSGLFLTVILIALFWKIYRNNFKNLSYVNLTLIGGLSFLACTGLMLVISRPIEVKIIYGGEILARRYMIFGAVFLCLGYLGYLNLTLNREYLKKSGLYLFIIIGLFLNLSSYYTSLNDVYQQQQELKLDGYYWKNYQMLLSFGENYGEKMEYNHPTYMINLINKLDSSEIYQLSQKESLPIINLLKESKSQGSNTFNGRVDTLILKGNTIARESKQRILFKGAKNNKHQDIKYIALKSKSSIFLIPAVPKVNTIYECLLTQTLNSSEFYYETWKAKFPSDKYEIWVIEKDLENKYHPLYCKKIIDI